MAPGAEVITNEDVLKLKIEQQSKIIKKEPQTKKGKDIKKNHESKKKNIEKKKNMKKKRCDSEKENGEKKMNEPTIKKKKRSKVITPDTSVSDCFSIYSDSDDCDDDDDFINMAWMEDSNTPDRVNEVENPEDENNLAINDHVLVRYYSRKKWTYYVGYIEEIKAAEEVRYTIKFYKTVKNPLKFVLTKKKDCDDVPLHSVVKKVHLIQAPNNSKEFEIGRAHV